MRRRTLAYALTLLVLAGSACSRGSKNDPPSFQTESSRVKAKVTVKVRGAETIDYDGRTTILIYRTLDKRIPLGFRLFSVGIPDPGLDLVPKVKWRTGFDVLGYTGDGDYTIGLTTLSPSGPHGLDLPSGIQSNALLQMIDLRGAPILKSYNVALEPCTVTSSKRGRVGTLSCSKLRQDGPPISLVMTWNAL